ncbi:MAG TPA: D-alanine--D-alanine ligase [Dehalococcoidia bacterium]|nr:D-alanine--D-alanine ligase [Dehalococcoidia bacterium]
MKIGLSYDLKQVVSPEQNQPEDALEEYDSQETVEAITKAIKAQGHSVVRLGGGRKFIANILLEDIDLVFNIAEGLGNHRSREAQVPSILEMLDIHYSGSDPQCLAICLDKPLSKKLVALAGVCTPRWHVINSEKDLHQIDWDYFPFPAFIKPAHEGSSKGIRLSSRVDNMKKMTEVATVLLERYQQPVMVEEFIAGSEVTVGVVGNHPPKVLGIMRILPKKSGDYFVYSLEVKREWESLVDYECPAQMKGSILQDITDSSLMVFEALGCRDIARIDFRLNSNGKPCFLEINPLPGLNPHSGDLPIIASKMGWTYEALILAILTAALERYPQCV